MKTFCYSMERFDIKCKSNHTKVFFKKAAMKNFAKVLRKQ